MPLILGCSTVPDPYIPSTTGPVTEPVPVQGLQLTIEPIRESFAFRQPVTFRVILENVGDQAFWVPRNPHILFFWIYPSGLRDHYIRERPGPRYFRPSEVILLEPGFRLVYQEHIDTHYFPRRGIMEFRAHYIATPNLNEEIEPYWAGRLISNNYGVELH